MPANDPTLLFTNAGMVQFKDKFVDPDLEFKNLGPFSKACTAQRCLRAGGKHNGALPVQNWYDFVGFPPPFWHGFLNYWNMLFLILLI